MGVCVFAVKKAIARDAPDWVVTGSFGCGNEVIMDDLRDNVRYTEGEGGEIPGSIFFDIRHFDVVVISRNGALNQSAKGRIVRNPFIKPEIHLVPLMDDPKRGIFANF